MSARPGRDLATKGFLGDFGLSWSGGPTGHGEPRLTAPKDKGDGLKGLSGLGGTRSLGVTPDRGRTWVVPGLCHGSSCIVWLRSPARPCSGYADEGQVTVARSGDSST